MQCIRQAPLQRGLANRNKNLRTFGAAGIPRQPFCFGGGTTRELCELSDRSKTLRQIGPLLRRETTMVLATADAGGAPRSTPLWFVAGEDLRLYWFSSRSSRHSRNCARNPQASAAIFRSTRRWEQIRGLQLDGVVSPVADRRLRAEIASQYCARFRLGNAFEDTMRTSALYCFTPRWARYLDNREGFGAKIELRIAPVNPGIERPRKKSSRDARAKKGSSPASSTISA